MLKHDQPLAQQPVYEHLSYRWSRFGITLTHLGLSSLPALGWFLLVVLISPERVGLSVRGVLFVGLAGIAIADAFATSLWPSWPRRWVRLMGALPGLALGSLFLLPPTARAGLPLWPCLPVWVGGMAFVVALQFRRDDGAIGVAWRWLRGPRLLSPFVPPPPASRRLLPCDRAWP